MTHRASDPSSGNRVFLSCVSADFQHDTAPFPGLRGRLRESLVRADCEVKVQEEFRQAPEKTLTKLDGYIRRCAAVIQLVGENTGAVPTAIDLAEYRESVPGFLDKSPTLQAELGDFTNISYTQWEGYMALHHKVPLFVYATAQARNNSAQADHLKRLEKVGRFASAITDGADLLGQLIGDIHTIIPSVPRPTRKIEPSRIVRHAPKVLFGRETELALLDAVWDDRPEINVFSLIAWGGSGKTSLVAHWVDKHLAARGWPGVDRYFDWSFYSQGVREHSQASADLFISKALEFFDDRGPTAGSPRDRGARLAGLVRRHRTLLVLDGIEPLQYPPNSPMAGQLKDDALDALLQGLAMDNPGLCIVTSRESLTLLQGGTTEERKLDRLHRDAALALLRHFQVVGTDAELEETWRVLDGHALTLQLLGRFIVQAFPDRDIRHRSEVRLAEADRETPGRTAMKVLLSYEKWLESAGPERQRDLAVLRLTGFFDRPASADCLAALRRWKFPGFLQRLISRKWRQVHHVFGPLASLTDREWTAALSDLETLDLIIRGPGPDILAACEGATVDAHPLVREYFARQLTTNQPEAFRAGHSRLFDHLCETTEYRPDTLAGLQPLYQAVTHGCLAGRQLEVFSKVYNDRILRDAASYSTKKLGAIGANLGAVAAFFEGTSWDRLTPGLLAPVQGWLLNEAALCLRALGRLNEALGPMRAGLAMAEQAEDWKRAAIAAGNLGELELTLGRLGEAVADGRRAVEFADRSGDAFLKLRNRTMTAEALHARSALGDHSDTAADPTLGHLGVAERTEAERLFAEAERMQAERQPRYPLLCSLWGFRYVDLLLVPAERAAWRGVVRRHAGVTEEGSSNSQAGENPRPAAFAACAEAERRASQTLDWAIRSDGLLDIALDHLTLARARLYRALLEAPSLPCSSLVIADCETALARLREANMIDFLPKALLTTALHSGALLGDRPAAERFLDEARLIAERGPMSLYLADVFLHRARLFGDRSALNEAGVLIEKVGYGRRREELADTRAALA